MGPRQTLKSIAAICGIEKKRLRDGFQWDASKRMQKNAAAHHALVEVVSWAMRITAGSNIRIIDVLMKNQNKLSARLTANTIHGDGDHR
jgi:hypothetical protein